jgi:hypothetical protein
VIISDPPPFPGEPRDIADRAWHAGPGYRDIADLFAQAKSRLVPGGVMYLSLSHHSDLKLIGNLIADGGFQSRLAAEHSIWIDRLLLFELRQAAANEQPAERSEAGATATTARHTNPSIHALIAR